MSESKKVYFNRPQRLTQLIAANTSVIVAGRRTGKTDSIAAPFLLRNIQRMPGSTGGIVVPTFKHGLRNTLPGVFSALKRWGYEQNIHYVIGRNAPKSFGSPIIDPKDSEHVIRFYNGSVAVLISQDREGLANSLTLSWLLIDEARFVDYYKLKKDVLPANGGIKTFFGNKSCNHSMMVLSDMPQTQKGSWFLSYREKMNPDLIAAIEGLICEIYRLKQKVREFRAKGVEPPNYLKGYIQRLDRDLNRLRSVAVYYKEYSSIENIQLLGESYIAKMKRELTPLTFQTSILCQRIGIAKDGFYSSMRECHKYCADSQSLLQDVFQSMSESKDAAKTAKIDSSMFDTDVDPDQPLCIGMDYNANINWIVCGQPRCRRLNVLKSFYVKFDRKIPSLVDDFCRYYSSHRNKTVVFYYDSTALKSNYAVDDRDFRYAVVHEFERRGWDVIEVYVGRPMPHDEKYLLINNGFMGKNRLMPFFNRDNNEALILAVQSAGVSRGRNGFQKDKSAEKLAESEESLLEHRTDGTDAFDTLYIGCENFPQSHAVSLFSGGIL
ncbi:MAG: hypothetical protein NC095_07790 [Muribaculum sp.]|nr:hypothetical protein [Muribaculum sp.]